MENRRTLLLLLVFGCALGGMALLYATSPALSPAQAPLLLRWPQSPLHVMEMLSVIEEYKQEHFWFILSSFIYLYIFLQSFAIPGAVFLSIMAGPLFGPFAGFFLAQSCATLGSCLCFLLSLGLGAGLVNRVFKQPLENLRGRVQRHKHNLFWYMLFLRMTPLVPNWFVNLATGHVGIPLSYFALASLVGLVPNNVILVRTGLALSEISSFGFRWENFLLLLGLAFLSLLPTLFKGRLQEAERKMQ